MFGEYREDLSVCAPVETVDKLLEWQQYSVATREAAMAAGVTLPSDDEVIYPKLSPEQLAYPCGTMAKSLFTDTYQLQAEDGSAVDIDESGIAWVEDLQHRYKNLESPPDGKTWQEYQWLDMTDEHFIVWMRNSGLPTFRKLWGRISADVSAGTYSVNIVNTYDVSAFNGKKSFMLSNTNDLGGDNSSLGTIYLMLGFICLFISIAFLVCLKRRSEGINFYEMRM